MEFILTFLLVFIGGIWILGKVFPRILAWYIQRRIKKMGRDGASFGSFGNNGFAGFWNMGNFGQGSPGQGGFDMDAERRAKEEEIRKSKEQEGRVTIVRTQDQEKVIEQNIGEYVEYEEKRQDD